MPTVITGIKHETKAGEAVAIAVGKNDLLNRLADALGLPMNLNRLVIEAEVGRVVKVYAVTFPTPGDVDGVIGELRVERVKAVEVAPDSTVTVTRHEG